MPVSMGLRRKYQVQRSRPVEFDEAELSKLGARVVTANLVSEEKAADGRKRIRHHSERLSQLVMNVAVEHLKKKSPSKRGGRGNGTSAGTGRTELATSAIQ
jgi:hypothetical protein